MELRTYIGQQIHLKNNIFFCKSEIIYVVRYEISFFYNGHAATVPCFMQSKADTKLLCWSAFWSWQYTTCGCIILVVRLGLILMIKWIIFCKITSCQ